MIDAIRWQVLILIGDHLHISDTPSIPVPAQVYNPTYEQGSYHHHQQDVYASPTDAPPGYTVPAATTIPGPAETADLPKYVDCTLTETQQQPGPR